MRTNTSGDRAQIELSPDGLMRASLSHHDNAEPAKADSAETDSRRDDFGRLVVAVLPGQGARLWKYDAIDHVLAEQRLDRKAQAASTTRSDYDAGGRLVRRITIGADGKTHQTITRTYEGARLQEESDDAQTTRYEYDAAGHVARTLVTLKTEQGTPVYKGTLQAQHDPSTGEVSSRRLADGEVMRIERKPGSQTAERITLQSALWADEHERLGRWLPRTVATTMQGWLPRTLVAGNIAFHPFNGITGYNQGNGVATRKGFDIAGRLTALEVAGTRENFTVQSLGYGVGPRIRAIDEATPAPIKTRYEYTGFGALKPTNEVGPTKTAFGAATPSTAIDLDAQGRTTSDGTYRYTYTASGQVETVSASNGSAIARYRYNARGQRVSKTLDATNETTCYLWQDGKLVAEIAGSGEHRGEVSAQYLYLGDDANTAPIAKIETAHTVGNATARPRILYIHSDHRGAPFAMTDEAQHVVWHVKADAWGYVKKQDVEHQGAMMNIRLPGQYFDAETGLHDNWHRTYDARPDSANHGRYLSPDPIGYPDGPDAYAYVNGDPINMTDPTGLYEEDVHYYMTYFLAIAAGINPDTARVIALADQYVDNNVATKPLDDSNTFTTLWSITGNQTRLLDYHFVLSNSNGKVDPASKNSNVSNPISFQLDDLFSASLKAPTPCARFQFLGEYLHAFEDTFAHRDKNNIPYDATDGGLGFGHGADFSNPDYTYNHGSWTVNAARTLEMEKEVFEKLKAYGDPSKAVSESRIDKVLTTFNAIQESDDNTNKFFPKDTNNSKITLLNTTLKDLGFMGIDLLKGQSYSAKDGAKNRDKNLCDKSSVRLKQADYPGTILPTSACPK
jgi:RHS repeat-associated protein